MCIYSAIDFRLTVPTVPISPAFSIYSNFSFYFLISNLVAVILSFLEGDLKQNWDYEKNAPPLYLHFPAPWNWRQLYQFRQAKVGAVAVLFLWRCKKRDLFFTNPRKTPFSVRFSRAFPNFG
jgi:hypothetical protein